MWQWLSASIRRCAGRSAGAPAERHDASARGTRASRAPSEWSGAMASDTCLSFSAAPVLVPERSLADQLINTASHQTRCDGHVKATEGVAERKRRHAIVAQPVMIGDPVLQRPQLVHVRTLDLERDARNRRRWLESLERQQDVAVRLRHALDNKLSHRRRLPWAESVGPRPACGCGRPSNTRRSTQSPIAAPITPPASAAKHRDGSCPQRGRPKSDKGDYRVCCPT